MKQQFSNRLEFDTVRNASGTNAFVLTPQRWIANQKVTVLGNIYQNKELMEAEND